MQNYHMIITNNMETAERIFKSMEKFARQFHNEYGLTRIYSYQRKEKEYIPYTDSYKVNTICVIGFTLPENTKKDYCTIEHILYHGRRCYYGLAETWNIAGNYALELK